MKVPLSLISNVFVSITTLTPVLNKTKIGGAPSLSDLGAALGSYGSERPTACAPRITSDKT
jgi:hypothetical protein